MDNIEDSVLEELFFFLLDEGHTIEEIEEAMFDPEFDMIVEEFVAEQTETINEISTDLLKRASGRAHSKASDYRHTELEIGGKPWKYAAGEGKRFNDMKHKKYRQVGKFDKALNKRGVKTDRFGIVKEDNDVIVEGKRLKRLGKALGHELGITKDNDKGVAPKSSKLDRLKYTAKHLTAQAGMGLLASLHPALHGHTGKTQAGMMAGGLALQVRDRYKHLKAIGENKAFDGKVHLDPDQKLNKREYGASKFMANKSSALKDNDKSDYKERGHGAGAPVADDDGARNSRMLKGDYPWGKVGTTMTKAAMSLVKNLHKPADKSAAMSKIWKSQENFHSFLRGEMDLSEPKASKVTLSKVRGVH